MSAEERKNIETFVEGMAVATITKPSARDKQRAPGPSDLGDTCDVCVARKLANFLGVGAYPKGDFSLKAWLGTAVHEKLERDLPDVYRHAQREITVQVADIPGVGIISGHVDVFLPRYRSLVDWKTSDMSKMADYKKECGPGVYTNNMTIGQRGELAKLKAMDKAGMLNESDLGRLVMLMSLSEEHSSAVPEKYIGQIMLYLHGLRLMGHDVEYALLGFIPRDSNNISDIWITSCRYRPEVVQAVLNRTSALASLVKSGRIGELKPHPKCWVCSIKPRIPS
jgi:hypothetical protein